QVYLLPAGPRVYLSSAASALPSSRLAISTATGAGADAEPVDPHDVRAEFRTTIEMLAPSHGRMSSCVSPMPDSVESSQWLTVWSRTWLRSPGNLSSSPATASFCPADGSSSMLT